MKHEKIFLKDYFSFLGENGKNPYVETYLPQNLSSMKQENRKRPCIIICTGGGYLGCSDRESEPVALKFLTDGYNIFVLNYSVKPHYFPSQIREVAAVLEIIHKNAEIWNCDITKIAILGFSAGGHLAAHYSTMYNCKEVRQAFPESKPVNASVLVYPVITGGFNFAHKGSINNLIGDLEATEEIRKYFSCELNVDENTPPAFICHTAQDNAVPVENSLLYASALSKYKIPFELHIFPFGAHGSATNDDQTIANVTWINKYNSVWIDEAKKWLRVTFNI